MGRFTCPRWNSQCDITSNNIYSFLFEKGGGVSFMKLTSQVNTRPHAHHRVRHSHSSSVNWPNFMSLTMHEDLEGVMMKRRQQ